MKPFSCFVAGTDTEIGKTLIASAMLYALGASGVRAAGMKPVAAGAALHDGIWRNEDVDRIMAVAPVPIPRELVTPYVLRTPAAPHIAAAIDGVTIEPQRILDGYAQVRVRAEAVVIEGVGGFRVPLTDTYDTADLARDLDLPVVLVVGLRLGCINHALLTAEAIAVRGLRLAGWVANTVDPAMGHADGNVQALAARLRAPLLGWIPRLPQFDPAAAAAYLNLALLEEACSKRS